MEKIMKPQHYTTVNTMCCQTVPGQTHTELMPVAAKALRRVKMWADMQADRKKPITAGSHSCRAGFAQRKTVCEHITQSRLSMGVESMHA